MNASDPGERSTRVEREILEILERADAEKTPVASFQEAVRRKQAAARGQVSRDATPRWSLPNTSSPLVRIAGAVLFAVVAAMTADASRLIAVVFAIASAVAFFSLWVPSRPSGIGESPRWRGQRLDDDEPRFGFGAGRTPPWRGPKRPTR
ncbi:MAG: hypothetical protein ACRDJC_00490 [Thermomicrobiales bacterium]